ncbi:MAG: polyADP-ribose polymerase, partial [Harvfovirus sp.]
LNPITGRKPEYLFHGSPIGNWYSIMRNGLKNYSGTDMMANGQAHGPGIYMTDSVDFSVGYSAKEASKMFVIGVAQVLDRESFKKTPSIYVITDDNKILIRYLILTDGKHLADIQKYIMSDRVAEVKSFNDNINSIVVKRLQKEMKILELLQNKNEKFSKMEIEIKNVHGAIATWVVKVDSVFVIEIKFFDNYPSDPPFVRLVSPIVKNSPIVDHTGGISIPELTIRNWNTKITIGDILKRIIELLIISSHHHGTYDDENLAFENFCINQFR